MMACSVLHLPVHNLHNQSKDRVRPSVRSTTVAPGVRTIFGMGVAAAPVASRRARILACWSE